MLRSFLLMPDTMGNRMSTIQKIELFYVSIPLPNPISPAWYRGYTQTHQRMSLIRLTTDDGLEVISAGWVMGEERNALGPWLEESFLGVDPLDLGTIHRRLKEIAWRGMPAYWIEPAFWDLRGKIEQKPVYQLLDFGASNTTVESVPVYCSTIQHLPTDERLRSLETIQEKGFNAMKLRLGGELKEDRKLCREVRLCAGPGLALMLDADQGRRFWKGDKEPPLWKLPQALGELAAMQELVIEWLEEPVDMHAYDDFAVLRSESPIPIAGGEMNAGWHEFKVFIDKGSLDIFQPDATIAGGISTAVQVMDACWRRELHFTPSSGHNGLSLLVNLHVYAAWPSKFFYEFPFEPGIWTPEIRDALLLSPIEIQDDGSLLVPQTPGLGIALDPEVMANYATLCYEANA